MNLAFNEQPTDRDTAHGRVLMTSSSSWSSSSRLPLRLPHRARKHASNGLISFTVRKLRLVLACNSIGAKPSAASYAILLPCSRNGAAILDGWPLRDSVESFFFFLPRRPLSREGLEGLVVVGVVWIDCLEGGKNGRCNIRGMEERGRYESRMKARCHILDLLARLSRWNRSNGENGWDDINAWKQCLITAWMGKRSVNKWMKRDSVLGSCLFSFFLL